MKTADLIGYWIGQFIGATLGALVIYLIAGAVGGGYSIATSGLGQNGFGAGYQGGYSLTGAILYEFFATMLFVIVILGATQKAAPSGFAGLVIGLTLVAIHLLGIHITGTSVNPRAASAPRSSSAAWRFNNCGSSWSFQPSAAQWPVYSFAQESSQPNSLPAHCGVPRPFHSLIVKWVGKHSLPASD